MLSLLYRKGGGWDNTTFRVSCKLVSRTNDPQRYEINLSWAWFDEANPVNFTAPTDQGMVETTNVNGNFVIELPNTSLIWGGIGSLVMQDSEGVRYGVYNLEVF